MKTKSIYWIGYLCKINISITYIYIEFIIWVIIVYTLVACIIRYEFTFILLVTYYIHFIHLSLRSDHLDVSILHFVAKECFIHHELRCSYRSQQKDQSDHLCLMFSQLHLLFHISSLVRYSLIEMPLEFLQFTQELLIE